MDDARKNDATDDADLVFVDPLLPEAVRNKLVSDRRLLLTEAQKSDLAREEGKKRGNTRWAPVLWSLCTLTVLASVTWAGASGGKWAIAGFVLTFGLVFVTLRAEQWETAAAWACVLGTGVLIALPFFPARAMGAVAAAYVAWLGALLAFYRGRAGSSLKRHYRDQYVRSDDLDGEGRNIAVSTMRVLRSVAVAAESLGADADVSTARQLVAEHQWHIVRTLLMRQRLRDGLESRAASAGSPSALAALEPQREALAAVFDVVRRQADALVEYQARLDRVVAVERERREVQEITSHNEDFVDLIAQATGSMSVDAVHAVSGGLTEAEETRTRLVQEVLDAGEWLSEAAAAARREAAEQLAALVDVSPR
ncbi:hypothetical protein ACFW2Y_28685 [Streptomyces sp. NPDC058877]|uniref:hypothetical protein n=1 Tax=unclassified Streptomyces TaxID=2593676 RepID=UPI0036757104